MQPSRELVASAAAGLVAEEASRAVQATDTWRLELQDGRIGAVCTRVGRFGAENGTFDVLSHVRCAL